MHNLMALVIERNLIMKESDNYLREKIELWHSLQKQVNIAKRSTIGMGVIGAALVGISNSFGSGETRVVGVALLIPVVIMLMMFIIAYQNRVVAIKEGYLAYIEKRINEEIREDIYLWNTKIIPEFYKGALNRSLLFSTLAIFFGILYFGSFIYLRWFILQNSLDVIFTVLLYSYMFITFVMSIIAIRQMKNDKIREDVEEHVKKMVEASSCDKELDGRIIKEFVERD